MDSSALHSPAAIQAIGMLVVSVCVVILAVATWKYVRRWDLSARLAAVVESVPQATVGLQRAKDLLEQVQLRLEQATARLRSVRLAPRVEWMQAVAQAGPGLVRWRALGVVGAIVAWPLQVVVFTRAMNFYPALVTGTFFDLALVHGSAWGIGAVAVGDGTRPTRSLRVARWFAAALGTASSSFALLFLASRALTVDAITPVTESVIWLLLALAAESLPVAAGACLAVARLYELPEQYERDTERLEDECRELERAQTWLQAFIAAIEAPEIHATDPGINANGSLNSPSVSPAHPVPATVPPPNGEAGPPVPVTTPHADATR